MLAINLSNYMNSVLLYNVIAYVNLFRLCNVIQYAKFFILFIGCTQLKIFNLKKCSVWVYSFDKFSTCSNDIETDRAQMVHVYDEVLTSKV